MTEIGREQLVEMLWEKVEPDIYDVTKEQFIGALADWTFQPMIEDGVLVMIFGNCGPLLHVQSMGEKKAISRKTVRSVIQPLIDKYGYAETKTPKHETRQQRFNEALGFQIVGDDEWDIFYRIKKIRGSK